jgi:signal transduction histidine kinase
MLRRLLLLVVPLLVALFAALGVPLAANVAQGQTQVTYLDRLADAERFASLADDALRSTRTSALAAELRRYDDLYGIAVGVVTVDGRLLLASRPSFDIGTSAVRTGLETAFAGYRPERIGTVFPWSTGPMVVVEPVGRDSGVIAAVVIVSPTEGLHATVLRRWFALAALGSLPFLLAVGLAVRLSRRVLRPVRELDLATAEIAAGRLDTRAATVTGPPELRRLATSFNTMVDTVTRTLRRQRTFVADASHQLRNPLASLSLAVDNLGAYVRSDGRELHEVAVAEVSEMGRIVDALLELTEVEGTTPATDPQPVAMVFAEHQARWRATATAAGLTITVGESGDLTTYAPAAALGSLLDELVGNAARLSGGTEITVTAAADGPDVVLAVSDDGTGLSEPERTAASDRFWRGPAHQNIPGTGLGLAICREVVAAWGGRLTLHPVTPHGLRVRITLPAATDQGLTERR